MKSGFRETLDKILRRYGMATSGVIGTVIGGTLNKTRAYLRDMGYRVERGLSAPNYDFVYISRNFSTIENIKKALTKIDNGCIIIFRITDNTIRLYGRSLDTSTLSLFEFAPNQYFGVIVKGMQHEG